MANASPPATSAPSRSSTPQADAAQGEDDAKDDEKSPRSESDALRAAQQVKGDRFPDEAPVGLTLQVSALEQKPTAGSDAVEMAAGDGDEEEPQVAAPGDAEIVAASQYQAIVTAGSPEGPAPESQPTLPEAKSEVPEAIAGQADTVDPQLTEQAAGGKSDAVEVATASTKKVNDQAPFAEVVPVEKTPAVKQDAPAQPDGDALPESMLPPPSSKPSDKAASETAGTVADAIEDQEAGEEGTPIFAGRDEEQSGSRRRHDDEHRMASRMNDAYHRPLDPTSAEVRGPQAELASVDGGIESTAGSQAMPELNATAEAALKNASALPQPVISAAAAFGATASDAASTKSSSHSPPQIGNTSTQPAATENARRPASSEASGPGISDRIRLVQRVANAFQRLGTDGGEVRIRLHPAELGSVRLDLQIQGKRLNARVTTESEAARGVLREHLSDLRQRLSEQGIQVERIDVEMEPESEGRRESARDDAAGHFHQPQRRDGRTHSLRDGHDQHRLPTGEEAGPKPARRSLADAVAQPGVDLVF